MLEKKIKLMVVLKKMSKSFMDTLAKDVEQYGLSTMDYSILATVKDLKEVPMQKLGEYVFITSGTITYATNRLIKQGYLEKLQDDRDRRIFHLRLTKAGRDKVNFVDEHHLPYLDNLLSGLTEDELDETISVIKRLGKSVEEHS